MNTESSWVYVLLSLLPAFENMPMGFYKTESGIAGGIFCRKAFCKNCLKLLRIHISLKRYLKLSILCLINSTVDHKGLAAFDMTLCCVKV